MQYVPHPLVSHASIAYTDSKRSSATGGHTFCPMETAIRSPGRLIEDYRKLLQG